MESVVSLRHVSKSYGEIVALSDLNLTVSSGESIAVLGPNGAGKTTAISLLVGTRRPDTGIVQVFGLDPRQPAHRKRIGATPQESRFPQTLKTREVLSLVAAHYPASLGVEETAHDFGLGDLLDRQIGGLSGGQQRRLAVALAFIGKPDLVFLDEPTTGLDISSRRSLWSHVESYRDRGGTLLLTTHYLEEAEALADRIVVIDKGTVLFTGSADEIRNRLGVRRIDLKTDSPERLPVAPSRMDNSLATIYTSDSDGFVRELVKRNISFTDLKVGAVSLEEAFLALTQQEPETG